MLLLHRASLVTAALLGATPLAQADLITWGPVQPIVDSSEVRTNGTLVTARNMWASAGGPLAPTVNGVAFDATMPTSWTNAGWSLLNGSSTGDSEYDDLLFSCNIPPGGPTGNPTGWGGIRLDLLGNLTLGSTYEIQLWYADNRTGSPTNVLFDRVMTMSSATGAAATNGGIVSNLAALTQGPLSGPLDADPNNTFGPTDTVFGSFVVGTFTRTSSDELWLLVQGSHPLPTNVLRPHLTAFQIREVPANVGTNYCGPAISNSTGSAGSIAATGSLIAADNDMTLIGSGLPNNQFAIFINSTTQGFVPMPGGSQGNICLAGALGRYNGPGQVLNSGAGGAVALTLDLTTTPTPMGPTSVTTGQTWNFQLWYRDLNPGPVSNFTDGVSVTFN